MNQETQSAVEEFCLLFPNVKSTVDNANDLRRVTKIGYFVFKHDEDIEEVKSSIREQLSNSYKEAIVNEVEKELNRLRRVFIDLDSLHFLN